MSAVRDVLAAVDSESDALPMGAPEKVAMSLSDQGLSQMLEAQILSHTAGESGPSMSYSCFPWESSLRSLGTDDAVVGLWIALQPTIKATAFTCSTILPPTAEGRAHANLHYQTGLIRFACLDGLRVSMAASTFASMLVVAEMLERYVSYLHSYTTNYL
jgi:hypothetical protein